MVVKDRRLEHWVVGVAMAIAVAGCEPATGTIGPVASPTQVPAVGTGSPPPGPTADAATDTLLPSDTATPVVPCLDGQPGRLANPSFENQRIKATLFFSGQARDGTVWYNCYAAPNLGLYTVNPADQRHLQWSVTSGNRDFALDQMVEAGLNVVSMSSWGEDSLPCTTGWPLVAPMQTAPGSHDQLFAAAVGQPLLVMPFIESRNDWAFRDEFPRAADGRVAPGTVTQINNLVTRYLLNPDHPEWADQWVQVCDQNLEPRYAVTIIHASSDCLGPADHAAFAAGFDLVAQEVYAATGVKVGFFIDPLPPGSNAPGVFKPSPEGTGPLLAATGSVIGVQAFIPEIWMPGATDGAQLLAYKRDFSQRWSVSGLTFLMDISPGYDASVVFPGSIQYGFTAEWRNELASMIADYGQDGLVYNSWNGYTEGMAGVPTLEYGDTCYRWLQTLCAAVDAR